MKEVKIPVHYFRNEKWILLHVLGNSGNLRADVISSPTTTKDMDGHRCREVRARTSIKYYPKKWEIL
ncbi:MAG: hypothetical protein APG12_00070 [Candidatus Methanofastidiosum methylothiophilum]|uniref:Uncharacterized protein n=1 Tax=Candidatus Methanofastidiosum methylothiophilum TaxID=1705564 RepID=A0A150J2N5_9EURY|nr:MAG: hypothetical protein APG10_00230 [Candidatus Methanofastidiosum methylthiophilus]KYC48760.1 MAG: hypothetical protein APG11_00071 [Candidatus Methanofastidiosum methylthiophilus]KYC51408.1 MAG: hypothetical protein APG12_00070 [Candidatus Methanofastidiosum methylthiophilus]